MNALLHTKYPSVESRDVSSERCLHFKRIAGAEFRAYSNARGVLSHSTHIDIRGLRYPPYDRNRILREMVIPS